MKYRLLLYSDSRVCESILLLDGLTMERECCVFVDAGRSTEAFRHAFDKLTHEDLCIMTRIRTMRVRTRVSFELTPPRCDVLDTFLLGRRPCVRRLVFSSWIEKRFTTSRLPVSSAVIEYQLQRISSLYHYIQMLSALHLRPRLL